MTDTDEASLTRILAEHIGRRRFSDLERPAVEEAKRTLLDTITACLLGSAEPVSEAYRELWSTMAGPAEATVFGAAGQKRDARSAVELNAATSHQVELAPAVSRATLHVNGIVSAALAVAEREGSSGAGLIRAVVAGCETSIRFAQAMGTDPGENDEYPAIFRRGWWTPTVLTPVGAASACALLLGAAGDEVHQAWGLATGVSPTSSTRMTLEGATGKGFLMAEAAGSGMLAAELAHRGVTGLENIEKGWMRTIGDLENDKLLTEGLPGRCAFEFLLYKPFAAVGPVFAGLESALALAAGQPFRAEQIESVEIHGYRRMLTFFTHEPPRSADAARSSLSYCVAAALLGMDRGSFLSDAFEQAAYENPQVISLIPKISVHLDSDYDAEYPRRSAKARILVRTTDGRETGCEVDRDALSSYHAPSRQEIGDKFRRVAARYLSAAARERIVGLIWRLDELADIAELSRAFADGWLGG